MSTSERKRDWGLEKTLKNRAESPIPPLARVNMSTLYTTELILVEIVERFQHRGTD